MQLDCINKTFNLNNQTKNNAVYLKADTDIVGVLASTLCIIHCLLTPIIFSASAISASCSEIGPVWWKSLDFVFLVISYFAIVHTVKHTHSIVIPKSMYGAWTILLVLVVNAALDIVAIPHCIVYIPAMGLTGLHLYNLKYCRCEGKAYCI